MMAAGPISYWLNAFTDTPQFGGGFDQGIVNRTYASASYQILSAAGAGDRAAEIAALWLRAYGVEAIAIARTVQSPGGFRGIISRRRSAMRMSQSTGCPEELARWPTF